MQGMRVKNHKNPVIVTKTWNKPTGHSGFTYGHPNPWQTKFSNQPAAEEKATTTAANPAKASQKRRNAAKKAK